jgi:small-conductance mechanosensitive channel
VFGVETTTFAALIAGAGVAIGLAWSGLLANLAAGAFLFLLRPFKVGDFITAGGITGTVREIGLFVIREAFGEAGFPAPEYHFYLRNIPTAQPAASACGM